MPDKKLTDAEIKSALKGAILNAKGYDSKVWSIEVYKLENALDLINRLQAENDKKDRAFEKLIEVARLWKEKYNNAKAENERLLQELQYPQADTVKPMSEENIVHCKECKHLMFSDFEGECSKGYKGIVRPNDNCPFGVRERGESK